MSQLTIDRIPRMFSREFYRPAIPASPDEVNLELNLSKRVDVFSHVLKKFFYVFLIFQNFFFENQSVLPAIEGRCIKLFSQIYTDSRFFTSGFFMNRLHLGPEHVIKVFFKFVEHSLKQ